MMYFLLISLLLLVCKKSHVVNGEFLCPKTEPMDDVQADKLPGIWYMISRFPQPIDAGLKCIKETFTWEPSNVLHIKVNGIGMYFGETVDYDVYARFVGDPTVGDIVIDVVQKQGNTTVYGQLMATDYDSYLIYYACIQDQQFEFLWFLSKYREVSSEVLDTCHDIMEDNGIDWTVTDKVDQQNCEN